MTKQEIVDFVSEATGLTKVETETVMNGIMGTIIDSLANNERVELRGFGTFGLKELKARKSRNPRTGATVFVESKRIPYFRMGKKLKERIN